MCASLGTATNRGPDVRSVRRLIERDRNRPPRFVLNFGGDQSAPPWVLPRVLIGPRPPAPATSRSPLQLRHAPALSVLLIVAGGDRRDDLDFGAGPTLISPLNGSRKRYNDRLGPTS